jgi:hypothetical protein
MYYNKAAIRKWGKGAQRFRRWAAGAGMGLSGELWLVQAGIFANMLGYGAVLPFEIIYLHNGRGFSLTAAGRAGAVSRVATNAGIGLGGALGGLLAARRLPGFVLLFMINGVTSLIYVAVLVAVVRETPRPERSAGGYRDVLRDGAFRRLAAANLVVIAVGWGAFTWLLPLFARGPIGRLLLVGRAGDRAGPGRPAAQPVSGGRVRGRRDGQRRRGRSPNQA